MRKQKFLKRHRDGQAFPVGEKAHLPPHKWKDGSKLVRPKVKTLKIADLEFRESHPVDLDIRADYFLGLIKQNFPIAPIQVQKQPNGKWLVVDGHARVESFRRAGLDQIQAVVIHPSKKRVFKIKD